MKIRISFALWLALAPFGYGWDYEGHRAVNELAVSSLPTNFPTFVSRPRARARLAFLAGEADRWRNSQDAAFKHVHAPEHYFDVDELPAYGLAATELSPFRYTHVAQLAAIRAARPDRFPPRDPARDPEQLKELVGFLPWAVAESYSKLKSCFSYLKAYEEGGTPEEIANAEENVLYVMGVMGHFVGDATQPLHTTRHFNGWVGENPLHFTTNRTFHAWIDGGYFNKVGLKPEALRAQIHPARAVPVDLPSEPSPVFRAVIQFVVAQHALVEPLYQLDKDHKLPGREGVDPEGYAFLTRQLVTGAQFLGDLYYTAWQQARPDVYVKSMLARRKQTEAGPAARE